MANTTEDIKCGNFIFYNNFDSANLAKVEQVLKPGEGTSNHGTYSRREMINVLPFRCTWILVRWFAGAENDGKHSKSSGPEDVPDSEFNIWTKHDCHGTDYQNTNRTWFYFGVKAPAAGILVKINVVNLNKQVKMFSQGMSPVYKTVPGHPNWERIRDKPTFTVITRWQSMIIL